MNTCPKCGGTWMGATECPVCDREPMQFHGGGAGRLPTQGADWPFDASDAAALTRAREDSPSDIDWPAEMRESLAEVSVLADRVATTDSTVGEAISRLLNVVTWLVDENARNETALSAARRREDARIFRGVPL